MLIPCKSVSRFTSEVKKNQIHDLTLGQFDTLLLDSIHCIGIWKNRLFARVRRKEQFIDKIKFHTINLSKHPTLVTTNSNKLTFSQVCTERYFSICSKGYLSAE
jgi:hypothetical protein